MVITREKYEELVSFMCEAEQDSLDGLRAQVFFNTENGAVWLATLSKNERYERGEDIVLIYAVEPWKNKLKDLFEDENKDVDWDDENYKCTPAYENFEEWYFGDVVDGFRVFDILDEALRRNGITVE